MALHIDAKQNRHKIADRKKRSTSTVKALIDAHKMAIKSSGFCPKCRRVNSEHDNISTRQELVFKVRRFNFQKGMNMPSRPQVDVESREIILICLYCLENTQQGNFKA